MRVWGVPVFALSLGALALLALPALGLALFDSDWRSARAFLYTSAVCLATAAMIALAWPTRPTGPAQRSELAAVVGFWVLCPVAAAAPMVFLRPELAIVSAYLEATANLTTTGSVILQDLDIPDALRLWRALLAWYGGFATLVIGLAILEPRNLGGFEIENARPNRSNNRTDLMRGLFHISRAESDRLGEGRILRAVSQVAPVYGLLTLAAALLLRVSGMGELSAVTTAMGLVSTTGGVGGEMTGSWGVELVALVFMTVAATRVTFFNRSARLRSRRIEKDPEIRLFVLATLCITAALFLRHWAGAQDVDAAAEWGEALRALWGVFFMAVSFLTTTGIESAFWQGARDWSGLPTTGLIFMGLAATGGGVASTAGGVKLLRAAVLFQHGLREMDRLAHPRSVAGSGAVERRIRYDGAQLAWVATMLFLSTLVALLLLLTFLGSSFDQSLAAAIASLSNTGPVYGAVIDDPLGFSAFGEAEQLVLAIAMALGRIETLALVALLNPEYWRR